MSKITTKSILIEFEKIHGNRYIYDDVEYNGAKTKVKITCREHGIFYQSPCKHKNGQGCNKCSHIEGGGKRRKDTVFAIDRFIKVHSDKYDYSKVKYINNSTNVTIICKKHGDFEQVPYSHYAGRGCPECKTEENRKLKNKSLKDRTINRAIFFNGDKYTFERFEYVTAKHKSIITCKIHGDFKTTPDSINGGSGCPKCFGFNKTNIDIINGFEKIHGRRYDYSQVNYKLAKKNVEIICHEHGSFFMQPTNHLAGQHCSLCGNKQGGFKKQLSGILYYLSINNGEAYKIGITNRSVIDRFGKKELERIKIISTTHYEDGNECAKEERRILEKYKKYKYNGRKLLKNGNTEMFSIDIFKL